MFLWRSALEAPLCSDSPRPSWPNKTPRAPVMTGPRDIPPAQDVEKQLNLHIFQHAPMSHFSRQLPSTPSQMSLWALAGSPLGLESLRSRLSESKLGDGFPCLTSECQWQKWKGAGGGMGWCQGGCQGILTIASAPSEAAGKSGFRVIRLCDVEWDHNPIPPFAS